MFQDELQPENHLERSPALPQSTPYDAEVQRKRMLIALGILLMALSAVIIKDWDFWFPPGGETQETRIFSKKKISVPVPTIQPAAPGREHKAAKAAATPAPGEAPFSATTERAALPELQVEVVAGNRHVSVPATSSAIHLDVDSGATSSLATPGAGAASAVASNASVNAGNRVQLSPQTTQSVSVTVPPDYPLLARQMKVQGAVILQALISRDGKIQELQIVSGPTILATAAREAVKQWHFKPYLQNGQAVETQAHITVNFTISTN